MLSLARSPVGRLLAGWLFAHMSFAIPVHRLCETKTLLAFSHPRPAYPVHILIVPKKAITSLQELDAADEFTSEFLGDLIMCVQSLVKQFSLQEQGYRLVLNGGKFQDVPQLHFHLITD